MSDCLNLNQIRAKELEILRHFDSYCKENGIQYFLSNGTLLGAVKYKGFIPWDDDIDVVMFREDYEKFVNMYTDSKYILYETRRKRAYRYPFAKLSESSTLLCETDVNNGIELGINMDIFPLDYINLDIEKAKKLSLWLHRVSMLLIYAKRKIKYNHTKRFLENIVDIFVGILSKFIRPEAYIKYIQKKAKKYESDSSAKYVASLCWSVYKGKEVMPIEVFSETVDVTFEGNRYPAPIGYDKYLRSLYGDYEKDPPKEKQVTHHFFTVYEKENLLEVE